MLDEERTLLAKRWPEMAAKIQKRLLGEGKITKNVCPIRTARFTRKNRIMEGHMQAVRYIVRISV